MNWWIIFYIRYYILLWILSATDTFKTVSKRVIQKTAEAACDSIGNKTADKFSLKNWVLNTSPKNNSETNEDETLRERYISPEQKTENY